MEIGIDKIRLTTRDFRVKDAQGLSLKGQNTVIGQDHEPKLLFIDSTGREVHGAGVFSNQELYNLDINEKGLKLEFNPSKPYHDYILCSDSETLHNRVKTVLNEVKEKHGIIADWEHSKVSRVDVSRNVETKDPIGYYGSVFSLVGMPRSKRQAQYPDGYSTGNNSTGIIMYNKLQEIRDSGKDIKGDNILRTELQFKKSQSVRSNTDIVTFNEMISGGVEHCKDVFRGYMHKHVFKEKAGREQTIIPFNDALHVLQELKKKYPRSYIKRFKEPLGLMELIDVCGGVENWFSMLAHVTGNRKTPAQERKVIAEQMKQRAEFLRKCPTSKRYKELFSKLVA